jgi:two-component system OmpR family response regulator
MSGTPHILIVDDDREYCTLLARMPSMRPFRVSTAHSATDAREILAKGRISPENKVDLILLDWKLSESHNSSAMEDGLALLISLRSSGFSDGIIMVTSAASSSESTMALDAGADDYVRKPFEAADLMARVRAVLRRTSIRTSSNSSCAKVKFGSWIFNLATYGLESLEGEQVRLRASEALLLSTFVTRPREILSKKTLVDAVYGSDADDESRSIVNLVGELREKLHNNEIIKAIRNQGYLFAATIEPASDVHAAQV